MRKRFKIAKAKRTTRLFGLGGKFVRILGRSALQLYLSSIIIVGSFIEGSNNQNENKAKNADSKSKQECRLYSCSNVNARNDS